MKNILATIAAAALLAGGPAIAASSTSSSTAKPASPSISAKPATHKKSPAASKTVKPSAKATAKAK